MRSLLLVATLAISHLLTGCLDAGAEVPAADTVAGKCMTCHREEHPGLYRQWYASEHGKHGVTCIDCHGADRSDVDAFEHEGALVATLVTPADCGECHEDETAEVQASHHATAGQILESKDAYLAHAAGGHPAAVAGCESCHGSKVEIDPAAENKLAALSWPNSGIGRINPDGSLGSCTACHTRHAFSAAQARSPESCGKCHLGPDHPQKEVYAESKHGNAFFSNRGAANLGADRWVVGVDYAEAPTCATCHLSATLTTPVTHDVGLRLSWTLRPPVSKHQEDWEAKRGNMQQVCSACHGATFVEGFYAQYDGVVNLYDQKFATPAGEIMTMIRDKGLLEHPAAFSNDIEWIYWELWHHEGRRARHGAAMGGPDYTWWHGIYDVAHNFYFEFLPAARELGDPEVNARIDDLLANDPMHSWISRDTADIKADIRSEALQQAYRDMFQP
jgi:hydroxylamine dehydrogenase